jgi:hypothetical protein
MTIGAAHGVRPPRTAVLAAAAVLAALSGCGDDRHRDKEPVHEPQRARRIIEPSTNRVGPLPPYAIRADGIGPYKLGEKLSDLLERLASGPRIALFEIPGVVHRNVIRAEDDTILIGGEQGATASFVAVVGGEVARTESGIHVGSTRDDVLAALGPTVEDPERARDPRLLVPSAAPSLRAVLEAGKVAALVVANGSAVARTVADCQRPPASDKAVGACLTAAGELVEVNGDELAVHSADGARMLAPILRLSGLVFAAPLRNAAEARDELIAITRTAEPASRTWWLTAYRLEGSRLVRAMEASQLYQLSNANARWIGAELRDVELYLELISRPDTIEVGGLLTTLSSSRTATKIRDVVVLAPASVARKRGKSAAFESAAGPFTAGATSAGSSQAPHVIPDAAPDAAEPAGSETEPSKP